jgi:hypothetical protein
MLDATVLCHFYEQESHVMVEGFLLGARRLNHVHVQKRVAAASPQNLYFA